jgi:UDP-2-acetamido-2,6-beta-L-arabino-hexul-4-ose reductase|tara:strand:+ start:4683 stop:5375 length:693 start_codon:yes stop_codon:yes gene_type:complete
MIVGDGLIAKSFLKKYDKDNNIIIFASGVSNSEETNTDNFKREKDLLTSFLKTYPKIKFIYISTILIGYKDNPYYNHKEEMEKLISKHSKDYIIFRVPQLIGNSGNSNNLVNYLVGRIKTGKSFEVYGGIKRAILDVEDLVNLVGYCKDIITCEIVNVGGVEPISVIDLSKIIQYFFSVDMENLKINNVGIKEDDSWTSLSSPIFKEYLTKFKIQSEGYTEKIIRKYIKQ